MTARSAAGSPSPVFWLLPVAVALVLRAGLGYRPFPSIDDFLYVPIALHHANPALFATDHMVRENVLHVPAWPLLVSLFGDNLGDGLWWITLALSVATTVALFRLMRATGVTGLLMPVAALLAFAPRIPGIGRATYDGSFGDAFHMQWLAICVLLFAYDAFARRRPVPAGLLLGLTSLAHPVVAAHGAVVLALASPWTGAAWWRRLAVIGAVAVVIALPIVPLLVSASLPAAGGAGAAEAIAKGILFRLPHEYDLSFISTSQWAVLGLMLGAGAAGAFALWRMRRASGVAAVAGLLFGHGVLLGVTVALHGPFPATDWHESSLFLYTLHLTRTTGLPVVLSALLATAAIEAALTWRRPGDAAGRVLVGALLVALATLLVVNVDWAPWLAPLPVAGLLLLAMKGRRRLLNATLTLFLAVAAGAAASLAGQPRFHEPPPEEAALYRWARMETPEGALFVVPPGLQEFRFFAHRSVFVDFKTCPTARDPELFLEWRRRLELVARPDKLALKEKGWPAVPQWDRSYALANTPARIADLLTETAADYVVWDARGLDIPPFAPVVRPEDPRVSVVFANERFLVYRLAEARRD